MTDRRRRCLLAVMALGVALAAAPAVFGMFTRAPRGGRMIADFRPHMTQEKIARFRGYLAEIDAAEREADSFANPSSPAGGVAGQPTSNRAVAEWRRQWPAIDSDMTSMLATMRHNLGRFRGVSALPPFPAFPWFFVAPGLIIAALGGIALTASGRPRLNRRAVMAIGVVGLGLVAAPAMFQMFSRAPGGARMIDDFRPLMTTQRVTNVQRYFVVIGAAEGELRTGGLRAAGDATTRTSAYAATRRFSGEWPRIANQMAPMIGAMADNVGNFNAVDALPPFWLFPWFFVLPGLLAVGLAIGARSGAGRSAASKPASRPAPRPVERSPA